MFGIKSHITPANRIWFLQLSRAIACLMIVYVHWVSFISEPNTLASVIYQSPLMQYPHLTFNTSLSGFVPEGLREALYSISLFFLISGFIIPFSMENTHPIKFLFRRIMRIYPTLIICLAITVYVILHARRLEHLSGSGIFDSERVWSNYLLIRNYLNQLYIDNSTWTLEIEMHFYLICFVLAFFGGQRYASIILGTAISLFVLDYWLFTNAGSMPSLAGVNVGMIGSNIILMFVGTCLYNYDKKYWSGRKTFYMIFALLVLNLATLKHTMFYTTMASAMYTNNLLAFLTFYIFYLMRDRLPYSLVMDKLAQISYPLYLVHGFTGYVFFFVLFKRTHNVTLSVTIALGLVLIISYLIHKLVEIPSINFSKYVISLVGNKKRISKVQTEGV